MKRFVIPFAAVALVALALVAAGCGSDNNDNNSGGGGGGGGGGAYGGGGSSSKSSSAPAAAGGNTVNVVMKNTAFNPKQIDAKVGQTIKWTNRDSVAHNVTATKGEEFHSETMPPTASYTYKVDKAGTISYVCTIHPGMTGTIVVSK